MARTTLLGTGDPGSPLHHLARNRECLVLLFEKAWAEEVRKLSRPVDEPVGDSVGFCRRDRSKTFALRPRIMTRAESSWHCGTESLVWSIKKIG